MQRKGIDVVNNPLKGKNSFEWKMKHFIERLQAGLALALSQAFASRLRLWARF
jgi:hypothetical protein